MQNFNILTTVLLVQKDQKMFFKTDYGYMLVKSIAEKGAFYNTWYLHYSPTMKKGHSVRHNFVSTQYFEKKLIEFHQTLILTRSRLGLLLIIFLAFVIELWPLIDVRISFRISFTLNILRTEW